MQETAHVCQEKSIHKQTNLASFLDSIVYEKLESYILDIFPFFHNQSLQSCQAKQQD